MTATNQQMTSEQLDELMVVAVSMQRDAEKLDERPVAVFAYAVQLALAELQQAKQQLLELSVKLANVESKCAELAAENAGLKESRKNLAEFIHEELNSEYPLNMDIKTPATDAAIANIQAQGVEMLLASLPPHYSARADIESFAAQLRQGAEHE